MKRIKLTKDEKRMLEKDLYQQIIDGFGIAAGDLLIDDDSRQVEFQIGNVDTEWCGKVLLEVPPTFKIRERIK